MAYDNQCGNCQYYDSDGYDPDRYPAWYKGYCSWYRTYENPGNSCRNQKPRNTTNSSGCYITTILCGVLGKDDDDDTLNTLRGFRDNIMQQNPMYLETLQEYDVVGPIIAENIDREFKETQDVSVWKLVFSNYIEPVSKFIKDGMYDSAVAKYKEMVEALKS